MTGQEIIRHMNDGANFYLRFFGDADHMEYHKNDCYSYIRPKQNEHGVKFAFDVKLENLPEKKQSAIIAEIRSHKMPVWWDLQMSDGLYRLVHGKERAKTPIPPAVGDELYMAVLPGEETFREKTSRMMAIKKAETPAEFEEWATSVNDIMNGGYADIHPVNHYHLCEKGAIHCFTCYLGRTAVAFASVMDNGKICSLEFVATKPDYRRLGFAASVCSAAMKHAIDNGAKIITLRAMNPGTRELYTSLGFKIYNEFL